MTSVLFPSPLVGVQTGDKVDGRSETSWTLSTANQGGCRMPFHEGSRMDARLEFVMLASVEGANVGACVVASASARRPATSGWGVAAGRAGRACRSCRVGRRIRRRAACGDGGSRACRCVRNIRPGAAARSPGGCRIWATTAVPAPSTVTAILQRHGVELGAHGGGQSAFTRFERDAAERAVADGLQGPCGACHAAGFIR